MPHPLAGHSDKCGTEVREQAHPWRKHQITQPHDNDNGNDRNPDQNSGNDGPVTMTQDQHDCCEKERRCQQESQLPDRRHIRRQAWNDNPRGTRAGRLTCGATETSGCPGLNTPWREPNALTKMPTAVKPMTSNTA